MKRLLAGILLSSCLYAESPSSVVIDGVEYIQAPKHESNVTETYTIPQSSLQGMEDCWYEKVVVTNPSEPSVNYGSAVLGGIIGGIIGHQFGSGSGKTAATVTGAVLGTAVGANSGTAPTTPQYQLIKKCNTVR